MLRLLADCIWTTIINTLQDSCWLKNVISIQCFCNQVNIFVEIVTKNVPDIILGPKFRDIVTNSEMAILSYFYHLKFLKVLTDFGSIRQINTARSLSNSASLKNIYWPRCGQTHRTESVLNPRGKWRYFTQTESVCCWDLGFFAAHRLFKLCFKVSMNCKHLLLVPTELKWETRNINGISFMFVLPFQKLLTFALYTLCEPPALIAELKPIHTPQTSGLLHSN